ncbi:3 beta-hydroxysteroid dehydrogenase/Delta 5--_4-isomerase type 1 [Sciurus carolinensis]|uniref:3 beta-hydroxysteroid dehydrogenase/Delta 5-->4-isomerase type 1 n=1 Tax=Sciurus carolinensis TaxID=30640 RepID=A0AA41N7W0_SCICA|nr:3 beta-hydroxysteroid dehydrogenase/Delta 5-->4-isomerase type 1 [Sciurus carolinensis]
MTAWSCLVTGAGGFLGQRIIQLLMQEEGLQEVRALDKAFKVESWKEFSKVAAQHSAWTRSSHWGSGWLPEEELRGEPFGLRATASEHREAARRKRRNMAGRLSRSDYIRSLGGCSEEESSGTQLLLEACIQASVPVFIYTSSVTVAAPNSYKEII